MNDRLPWNLLDAVAAAALESVRLSQMSPPARVASLLTRFGGKKPLSVCLGLRPEIGHSFKEKAPLSPTQQGDTVS